MAKAKSMFKNILYDSSLFRISYFINLFLGSVIFLDVLSIINVGVMMIWAGFIFRDYVKRKIFYKIKYHKIIFLFLISTIITTIIHIKMSFPVYFTFDLIMIYHYFVCFFLFYGLHAQGNKQKIYNEMFTIFKVVAFTTTILTTLGFIIVLFKEQILIQGKIEPFEKIDYVIGTYQKPNIRRFTGVFNNPNIAAFCSVLTIVFIHILIKSGEFFKGCSKFVKGFIAGFCFFINLMAIILSDSVASLIMLLVYIISVLIYKFFIENSAKSFNGLLCKSVALIVITTALIFSMLSLKGDIQDNFSTIMSNSSENASFGRLNYDITYGSGRKVLLEQAMVIFQHNPLLGIGISNIEKYGKLYFEDGIAFPNFRLGIALPNFHNGYVTILVCYGLIGFLIFAVFLFSLLKDFFYSLFKEKDRRGLTIFPYLLSVLCAYCVYALFEKTILSEINFMGLFFWTMLGYATWFVNSNAKKEL